MAAPKAPLEIPFLGVKSRYYSTVYEAKKYGRNPSKSCVCISFSGPMAIL